MVTISVCIVTYNSERTLGACLGSVLGQGVPFHEVRVLDNASADGTVSLLKMHPSLAWRQAPQNTGFAAGFNALLRETSGDWVLLFNPDARPPSISTSGPGRSWRSAPPILSGWSPPRSCGLKETPWSPSA